MPLKKRLNPQTILNDFKETVVFSIGNIEWICNYQTRVLFELFKNVSNLTLSRLMQVGR